jgi:DNA-binding LacI/PurR family transcriptional regulator
MADLGFEPNFFAQAMQSKRSNSIALIVQDLTNPYYPALARGLQEAMADENHVVMLFDARAGKNLTEVFVKEMIQRRVDGVVAAATLTPTELGRLERADISVVAVGSGVNGDEVDWVSADDEAIAEEATTYLHTQGYQRIAIIRGPVDSEPGGARFRGWTRALQRAGLEPAPGFVATADWTTKGGSLAAEEMLSAGEKPDAIFCANDQMAIGALNALLARSVRVPEDIAVVGVDDIDAAALVRPALTTVRVPAEEIGRAAGDLLIHRITNGTATPHRHILVQHSLIPRDSA